MYSHPGLNASPQLNIPNHNYNISNGNKNSVKRNLILTKCNELSRDVTLTTIKDQRLT